MLSKVMFDTPVRAYRPVVPTGVLLRAPLHASMATIALKCALSDFWLPLLSTVLAEAPIRTHRVEIALRGAVWDPGASIYGRWKCTQGGWRGRRCGRVGPEVLSKVLFGTPMRACGLSCARNCAGGGYRCGRSLVSG